jgi:hypothetical protein
MSQIATQREEFEGQRYANAMKGTPNPGESSENVRSY